MPRASSADWLNRRGKKRRQCSGTGTITSASATSSSPARTIQRAIHRRKLGAVPIFQPLHHLLGDAGIGDAPHAPGRTAADWHRLGRQEARAHLVT